MGFTLQHSTLQWPACRTVAFEESTSHCQFRVNVPTKHFGTRSVRIFNKNVSPTNGFMLVVPSLGHIIPFRHFPIHNNGHLVLVLLKHWFVQPISWIEINLWRVGVCGCEDLLILEQNKSKYKYHYDLAKMYLNA